MSAGQKPVCQYGDKCFRKNPQHFLDFSHPAKLPPCKYGASCYRTNNPGHVAEFSHPDPPQNQHNVPSSSGNADGDATQPNGNASNPSNAASVAALNADIARGEDEEEDAETEHNESPRAADVDEEPDAANPPAASSSSADNDELACINGVKPKYYLRDGETKDVQSKSSSSVYRVKRTFGHFYCTCPAWRNQNAPVDSRSCKHLKELLGEDYEAQRCKGAPVSTRSSPASSPAKKRADAKAKSPELLLAMKFEDEGSVDPTGWWLSEKLDGVRAMWDHKRGAFISRLGNEYPAPPWFSQGFPKTFSLDGELFGGRGQFQSTVSIVKTTDPERWKAITYQIFDVLDLNLPFEDRLKHIETFLHPSPAKTAVLLKQELCQGKDHLLRELKVVESKGGEGLMLRKPGSLYVHGRSNTLLKVKSFYEGEAIVEGYEDGKGRHKGRVGALKCVMANGKRFKVGTGMSDRERDNPPALGSIITYRLQELTVDGVPRFPSYIGQRLDMTKPKDPEFPSHKRKRGDDDDA